MPDQNEKESIVTLGGSDSSEILQEMNKKLSKTKASVEITSDFNDSESFTTISKYQLIYSLFGLILGAVCILGGIVLFLNGVVGSISWTAKILGSESNISDAAPGAILFVVGLFVVLTTRFSIKVKK